MNLYSAGTEVLTPHIQTQAEMSLDLTKTEFPVYKAILYTSADLNSMRREMECCKGVKYFQIWCRSHTRKISLSPLMEFGKIGYPGQRRIEKQLRESMSVENLLGYIYIKNHGNTILFFFFVIVVVLL